MNIKEYLNTNRLISDGAFGTYYAQLKHQMDTISEQANLNNPDLVKQIHRAYIESGARLIRTNTFAANGQIYGEEQEVLKLVLQEGYRIARETADVFETETGEKVFVAADIGPIQETALTDREAVMNNYRFLCDTFLECGADILLFETFSDLRYLRDIVTYAKNKKKELFILTQFCLNRYGFTKSGIRASRLIEAVNGIDEIDAVGFNCGIGSGHMVQVIRKLTTETSKFISIMPNSGYPEWMQDRTVYLDNAKYFADRMKEIADWGADIIGGCCGTNPDYISKTSSLIDCRVKKPRTNALTEDTTKIHKCKTNPFIQKLQEGKKVIAVELDPPYDAEFGRIMECANQLKASGADIITFADSPMGRARVDSIAMSIKVLNEVDIPVMPHICCRDKNLIAMRAQLLGGYINQIRNTLIVTGDPIPSGDRDIVSSVFDFNSIRLMEFVSEMNQEHFLDDPIVFGGALNHNRANREKVIERLQKKINAGAMYFLTQPVFSDEDIETIRYIKSKVDTKILCGVMPLISYRNALFVKNEITGIQVPDEILNSYRPDMTREEGEDTGIRIAKDIIRKLDDTADGYYFMLPFNRVHLVEQILGK